MRPTRAKPYPGFTDAEIAEQIAEFEKRGGKIEQVKTGEQPQKNMREIHDATYIRRLHKQALRESNTRVFAK